MQIHDSNVVGHSTEHIQIRPAHGVYIHSVRYYSTLYLMLIGNSFNLAVAFK